MTPVVELSNLTKKYDDYIAVDNVSLTVESGTVLALLGTNGAGKTTTLDMTTGLLKPTSGSVHLFGVDPHTDRDRVADRMGIMLQEAGFFDGLTVEETIKAWRRFTPRARDLDEAVTMVSLERQLNTAVGRLSGGERRRLDLALALLGKPDLLFLDEPTTGLDPAARQHIWELLSGMVGNGLTVVLTTHYMEEAERLADTVAIIDGGHIVRQGALAEFVGGTQSVVSIDLATATDATRIPLPADAEISGRHVDIATSDVQRTLRDLLDWAHRTDYHFDSIKVGASTLEDTFLRTISAEEALR